jgi:hypothetical protein
VFSNTNFRLLRKMLLLDEDYWHGSLRVVGQPPAGVVALLPPHEETYDVSSHDTPDGVLNMIVYDFKLPASTQPVLHKGPRPADGGWLGRVSLEAALGTVKEASTASTGDSTMQRLERLGWAVDSRNKDVTVTVYITLDAGAQQQVSLPAVPAGQTAGQVGSSGPPASGATPLPPAAAAAAVQATPVSAQRSASSSSKPSLER